MAFFIRAYYTLVIQMIYLAVFWSFPLEVCFVCVNSLGQGLCGLLPQNGDCLELKDEAH